MLRLAMELIRQGLPLPVDVHARLVAKGYDVETLVRKHSP
jgi:hypothetical protein